MLNKLSVLALAVICLTACGRRSSGFEAVESAGVESAIEKATGHQEVESQYGLGFLSIWLIDSPHLKLTTDLAREEGRKIALVGLDEFNRTPYGRGVKVQVVEVIFSEQYGVQYEETATKFVYKLADLQKSP